MNPYDLFIHIDRFHTVAGNTDAEVRGCRDIVTDFKFLILIRVKKEAGTGRRRVGKTYLICEYFNQQFSFYTTGLSDEKMKGQLRAFQASLNAYGYEEKSAPADWFEAFARLKEFYNYKETLGD